MPNVDVAIIGGGIVGLATAYNLSEQFPNRTVIILEKENGPAHHQTGHNSGVLHSGIYYKPGSSKAINCRNGKLAMEKFCEQQSIDFEVCGKVIVAVDDDEMPTLQRIYQRGCENGVQCEIIDRDRLSELEPHAAGVAAIHVPEAGIINYRQVCERLRDIVTERGGRFIPGAQVTGIRRLSDEIVLETSTAEHAARFVVNCAGLYSDRITRLGGQKPTAKIVPFRGEYYKLKDESKHLCKNLIYPVPDPSFPFLGVHFTRMINGSVECGPNAVLAFAREGYRMRDVNVRDLFESLTYSGFVRMALKYWRTGCGEMWRSFSKRAFVKALSRLLPDIRSEHLESAPAGVRAQAVTSDGKMVDDFLIQETDRVVNVGNAPSPAATASLNIGRLIVEKLASRFE